MLRATYLAPSLLEDYYTRLIDVNIMFLRQIGSSFFVLSRDICARRYGASNRCASQILNRPLLKRTFEVFEFTYPWVVPILVSKGWNPFR